MHMFWFIVYLSSLFYICVALPYGLFFAETDEEKDYKWRVCSAFKNTVILMVLISCVLFPAYAFMKYTYIPVEAVTCSMDQRVSPFIDAAKVVTLESSICKMTKLKMQVAVSFPIFSITAMTSVGWLFLCFFLPTGMQALPFDLIGSYVLRPKPMKEDEFNRSKAELAKKVQQLL